MKRYWIVGPAGNIINPTAIRPTSGAPDEAPQVDIIKAIVKHASGSTRSKTSYSVVVEEVNYAEIAEVEVDVRGRTEWSTNECQLTWHDSLRSLSPYGGDNKLPPFPPEVQEEIDRVLIDAESRAKLASKIYRDEANELQVLYDSLKAKCQALKDWLDRHYAKAETLKALIQERNKEFSEASK